jgi:hypothetical protein
MTSFQWIVLVVLGISFTVTVSQAVRRAIAPRVALAWGLLWIAAAVAIARPELTVVVARALGIGRGADLVLYVAILAMGFGFFAVYVRLRRIESDLTKIVRELAIRSAEATPQERQTSSPTRR